MGEIPQELGQLDKLVILDLSQNLLTGSIPESLGDLSNLRLIDLSFNLLVGRIPKTFERLINLWSLNLESNNLSGEIPDIFQEMHLLSGLFLDNNLLTGSIPSSFSQLKSLEAVDFSELHLSGVLPDTSLLTSLTLCNSTYIGTVARNPAHRITASCDFKKLPTTTTTSWQTWQQLDFSAGWEPWNIVKDAYGEENGVIAKFSTLPNFGSNYALQVLYPAGSYVPSAAPPLGGTGFYAAPLDLSRASRVILEYQVYFPAGFKFVKGGKLPGLYGGHTSCSGGNPATDCFSTRLMWRQNGAGEAYLYLPKPAQTLSFCTSSVKCFNNEEYAYSYGRGTFTFKTGQWTSIRQVLKLNTVSGGTYQNNGVFRMSVNGVQVMNSDVVAFRTFESVVAIGIDFETFFGGNDPSYASPVNQATYFKGVKLFSI